MGDADADADARVLVFPADAWGADAARRDAAVAFLLARKHFICKHVAELLKATRSATHAYNWISLLMRDGGLLDGVALLSYPPMHDPSGRRLLIEFLCAGRAPGKGAGTAFLSLLESQVRRQFPDVRYIDLEPTVETRAYYRKRGYAYPDADAHTPYVQKEIASETKK